MVTLVSPGVDVQIIDESFYGGAGPGTVPLILLATAANKTAPSGTGIAPYSSPDQAGKLFLATSQRELVQNFGTPTFKTVQGTPVHGHELNEYGLLAAYQFLGISNRAYVLRADIDLAELEPSAIAPVDAPAPGTYWFDLSETKFGVFQSNGNANPGLSWSAQPVLTATEGDVDIAGDSLDVPKASFGSDGDFSTVVTLSNNLLFEKISGLWYQVGAPEWKATRPTKVTGTATSPPSFASNTSVFTINGVTIETSNTVVMDTMANTVTIINESSVPNITASVNGASAIEIKNNAGDFIDIGQVSGDALAVLGLTTGRTDGQIYTITNTPQYPIAATGSVWVKGHQANNGATWKVKVWNATTGSWVTIPAPFFPFDATQNDGVSSKDQAATAAFAPPAPGDIYVGYHLDSGTQQLRRYNGTFWENLIYEAGTVPPSSVPAEDTIWFNTDFAADIMYGDGTQWKGYKSQFINTDPAGVIISGSAPTLQSDGTILVDNDLWLDSSDLENYPMLYRWDSTIARWNLIDKTDQTSPFGIIFADARENSGTNYTNNPNLGYTYGSTAPVDLVQSNFVDPDAPDARTYPAGVLLFNTRVSTYNVKQWKPEYFSAGGFDPNEDFGAMTYQNSGSTAVFPALGDKVGRWVTASGNKIDGSPYMGRKAQRAMIVRALEATITANEDIRSELVYYNLLASPGYPELMEEMVTLNVDQKEVSFIVGDTPSRLQPTGTDITHWATNANNVAATGEDGLTVGNEYTGVYYPWGLSVDLSGNEVMMPPSSMALNTLAYNDQVAYPWYAPAGYRRGLVTNASSVGYLTSEGEFKPVILSQGQRDVLYTNKINPIAYIPGRGLVVYGQKTLNPVQTALDRINVARLANYLKYNLENIVKPFLFEQNDVQTRASATTVVTGFLNGLVGLRAVSDYAVVCDESNNTSARIDANELWIDIAVKPLHAIEFIYIPVRILNTGDDLATSVSQTLQI